MDEVVFEGAMRPYVLFSLITAVAFTVLMDLAPGPMTWAARLTFLAAVFSTNALICAIWRHIATIEVARDGIRAYTWWARKRSMGWNEVDRVSTYRILNLTWIKLAPKAGAPIYIPDPLTQHDRFHELVLKHVGAEHPLSVHLRRQGT